MLVRGWGGIVSLVGLVGLVRIVEDRHGIREKTTSNKMPTKPCGQRLELWKEFSQISHSDASPTVKNVLVMDILYKKALLEKFF